ncbi:MAG: 2-succinyl-5-enolpyruvyl-6-hydroxy-3-cyclohexene-1-carboxylic-acid synthase [Anaerolinea sp.]|nr:2-succinyl-5-enolpyruvyl-6-hydroxy-3-cyclohexene-1-carboxylic-acid synthase [Anaerolinea sp.]
MNHSSNPATLWAELFVHALALAGLRRVVVAPGSRSTPLTLAFAAHPDIELFLHLDERSAGFFALGMALTTDKPVALVCTSGTAVANFFPAITEANMSQVPLLILTADRPPELRHSGANQTIDQIKIYGDQVLWSVDAPLPEQDAPEIVLRHLQTLAARAYATANGLRKGPVHVNFPFRKPLEPVDGLSITDYRPPTTDHRLLITKGQLAPTRAQLSDLAEMVNRHERGLIVCGPRCPGDNFPTAVSGLSQITGYPILADPLSGVRWGRHVNGTAVCGAYETYLQQDPGWPEPELILRFGAVPTSKWLNDYLGRSNPAWRIHVRENGVWADDSHLTTYFLQVNEELLCYELAHQATPRMNTDWTRQVMERETAVWHALDQHLYDPYFDASAAADVLAALPDNTHLFVGNSLPIRHVDQWGRPSTQQLHLYGNRGASGIDGNTSTALGIAAASGQPTVALLGDITFYHDLNGLFMLKEEGRGKKDEAPSSIVNRQSSIGNVTIILLHNNGGGIFHRLPVRSIEPPFTDLFITPHGLDFSGVIQMYGLAHVRPQTRAEFQSALSASLHSSTPTVIELQTNSTADDARRRELMEIWKL